MMPFDGFAEMRGLADRSGAAKPVYRDGRAAEVFDLIQGRQSPIGIVARNTGISDKTICAVTLALSQVVIPDRAIARMRAAGMDNEQIGAALIGFEEICLDMILQHAGLEPVYKKQNGVENGR